jgi:predicted nucleotide-binding protein
MFVANGYNPEARDKLESVLMRLGLQPFIVKKVDDDGRSLAESLEQHIHEEGSPGIVILIPKA